MSLEEQILDILVKHKRRKLFNDSDFVVPELLTLIETEKAKAVREALIEAKFNVKNKVLRYCSKSQQEPMGEAITHAIHQILLEEEKHG